jgi:hypothetical protein
MDDAASRAAATRICARIAGPFLLFTALAIFSRYESLPMVLPAFAQNEQLLLVTGAFTTITGLTMLAFHHHFSSPPAAVLSVIAILITVRGLSLCAAPEFVIGVALEVAHAPVVMLIVTAICILLGGWLSYVGWVAKSIQPWRVETHRAQA